ncbi:MAG: hypothetical protein AAGA08_10670 [Pseudomonadota bacterium]
MKWVLLALLATYVAYALVMIWLHPRFIYPFQPDDVVLDGFERVELAGADGTPVFVQERKGSGPAVLYFMGNAGAVAFFETAFTPHLAADRHVIALEYRGGAGRPGVQSEAVLKSDALVAADYALSKSKPVVAQGYSLGSGLATYVAARRLLDGVVLVAPYDRLCRLLSQRSFLPACYLPFVQKWTSIDEARRITVPIHVLHGSDDNLIPPRYSVAFSALPNVTRRLIDGAGHTDIGQFEDYQTGLAGAFEDFLARSES